VDALNEDLQVQEQLREVEVSLLEASRAVERASVEFKDTELNEYVIPLGILSKPFENLKESIANIEDSCISTIEQRNSIVAKINPIKEHSKNLLAAIQSIPKQLEHHTNLEDVESNLLTPLTNFSKEIEQIKLSEEDSEDVAVTNKSLTELSTSLEETISKVKNVDLEKSKRALVGVNQLVKDTRNKISAIDVKDAPKLAALRIVELQNPLKSIQETIEQETQNISKENKENTTVTIQKLKNLTTSLEELNLLIEVPVLKEIGPKIQNALITFRENILQSQQINKQSTIDQPIQNLDSNIENIIQSIVKQDSLKPFNLVLTSLNNNLQKIEIQDTSSNLQISYLGLAKLGERLVDTEDLLNAVIIDDNIDVKAAENVASKLVELQRPIQTLSGVLEIVHAAVNKTKSISETTPQILNTLKDLQSECTKLSANPTLEQESKLRPVVDNLSAMINEIVIDIQQAQFIDGIKPTRDSLSKLLEQLEKVSKKFETQPERVCYITHLSKPLTALVEEISSIPNLLKENTLTEVPNQVIQRIKSISEPILSVSNAIQCFDREPFPDDVTDTFNSLKNLHEILSKVSVEETDLLTFKKQLQTVDEAVVQVIKKIEEMSEKVEKPFEEVKSQELDVANVVFSLSEVLEPLENCILILKQKFNNPESVKVAGNYAELLNAFQDKVLTFSTQDNQEQLLKRFQSLLKVLGKIPNINNQLVDTIKSSENIGTMTKMNNEITTEIHAITKSKSEIESILPNIENIKQVLCTTYKFLICIKDQGKVEDVQKQEMEEEERKLKEEVEREDEEIRLKEEVEKEAKEKEEKTGEEKKGAEEKQGKEVKEESEKKAKEEVGKELKEEIEKQVKEEAKKLSEEAKKKAKAEEEKQIKEEQERKLNEEAEKGVKEEEKKVEEEEAKKLKKDEEDMKVKEEQERKLKEDIEQKANEEQEIKQKEEIENKAKEDAKKKAKVEKKVKEEEEKKPKEEQEKKLKEEAEKRSEGEGEKKARKSKEKTEEKATEDEERVLKGEAEKIVKGEVDKGTKEETDKVKKDVEVEKQSKEEDEEKAKKVQEKELREEADRKAKEEEEKKAKDEEEKMLKLEGEKKAREEEEKKAKEEEENKLKEEIEKKTKEEEERNLKEEERTKRKAKAEAENKVKEEEEQKVKEEKDRQLKQEAERKAKAEEEKKTKEEEGRRLKEEAEKEANEEAEKRAKEEKEKKAKGEEERRFKEEAEKKAKEEEEIKLKEETERKAKEEADKAKKEAKKKAKAEVEKKAKEEEEKKAREEQEEKRLKEEAEKKAKEEADKTKREAKRKATTEAEKKAKEEEEKKAKDEEERKVKEEAERKAKEEEEKKVKEEAEKKSKEEAETKAKEEADKAKNEAKKRAK
ncbi:hypothetical protein Trydic_g10871, partial [Trypoxylus dichotomus]